MKRMHTIVLGGVCLGGLSVGSETVWAFQPSVRKRLPNLDKRQSRSAVSNTVLAKKPGAATVRGVAPGVPIDLDEVSEAPMRMGSTSGFWIGLDGRSLPLASRETPFTFKLSYEGVETTDSTRGCSAQRGLKATSRKHL